MMRPRHLSVVVALGLAQTLAWASTYYLPAMLAEPMARDLGVTTPTIFAAFSLALVVSALLGPWAGRAIDRWGARPVLSGTNLVFALGLAALANAHGPVGLFGAWVILGIGMGSGLYEAAFSALVRLYGRDSRSAITGITLVAGFASTIGWPLSNWLEHHVGWRGACQAWAALHLALGLPLNLSLPRVPSLAAPASKQASEPPVSAPSALQVAGPPARRARVLLATVFAATWFISTAMAAHLPRLLHAAGASLATAVAVGALIGPAQVTGRLLEFGFLRQWHPLLSARLAALMHPIGAALLLLVGSPMAALFALVHGAGNGILTIANGTLPLVLFGSQGYGQRQGLLMMPARLAQAASPWVFGLCLDAWGAGALWLSGSVGLLAFCALLGMPRPSRPPPAAAPAVLPSTPT
jgi:predicted MFS family arabinose efflux permease